MKVVQIFPKDIDLLRSKYPYQFKIERYSETLFQCDIKELNNLAYPANIWIDDNSSGCSTLLCSDSYEAMVFKLRWVK